MNRDFIDNTALTIDDVNDVERNRRLGKAQDTRRNLKVYVELAFCDTILGLRKVYHRLKLEGKSPSATEIADEYGGYEHLKDNTLRQIANIFTGYLFKSSRKLEIS